MQFVYVETAMSWDDARANCQSMGLDLASIHSAEELAEVLALLPSLDQSAWIGLSDASSAKVMATCMILAPAARALSATA